VYAAYDLAPGLGAAAGGVALLLLARQADVAGEPAPADGTAG
jgi:hypothetical protein